MYSLQIASRLQILTGFKTRLLNEYLGIISHYSVMPAVQQAIFYISSPFTLILNLEVWLFHPLAQTDVLCSGEIL